MILVAKLDVDNDTKKVTVNSDFGFFTIVFKVDVEVTVAELKSDYAEFIA